MSADRSTYVEDGDDWFAERPEVELPDLSRGDHEDAAEVRREQVQQP